jgi:hypothetical protein
VDGGVNLKSKGCTRALHHSAAGNGPQSKLFFAAKRNWRLPLGDERGEKN